MIHLALVAIGGAIGAGCRHLVNLAALRLFGPGYPGRNARGECDRRPPDGACSPAISRSNIREAGRGCGSSSPTGILGGFTTFSAFSLDAVLLWERGDIVAAVVYVLLSVVLSIGALARRPRRSCGPSHEGCRDEDASTATRPASGSTAGSSSTIRALASAICKSSSAPARCASMARVSKPRRGLPPDRRSACRRSRRPISARRAGAASQGERPRGAGGCDPARGCRRDRAEQAVRPRGAGRLGPDPPRRPDARILHRPAGAKAAARPPARP